MEQVVSFLFKYRPSLFSRSQFGFAARPSVFLIAALLLALAFLVYFLYANRSLRLSSSWRAGLIALRCALIALIAFCLMRPVMIVSEVIPQSTYVAVLLDDSASMKLAGEAGDTRLETIKRLMSPDGEFYKALSDKFKVRAYKFSSTTERIQSVGELEGEGQRTDLLRAVDQGVREAAGLPLSGVVVMSDGASNGDSEFAASFAATLANLRARGLPVFTVGVGPLSLEGDVEIVRATAPRRVLVGSPVTAELLLRASGGGQKSVRIELTEDSHPLPAREVAVQAEATTVARVTFTPTTAGLHRYRLTATPSLDEPVTENNSQEILIDVEDSHPKILYMEGEPRWEYGKMREALAEEKSVMLASVLRSADGKYYRQGVENPDELSTGFPKSEEDLFKYDAIIIGSIEATFFTFDQLKAIEQFVSRRGGTLLALGGAKSLSAGGYGNTPVADLLPVYLRGENTTPGESQVFKAIVAGRGRDHPAARLADQPEANDKAWEQLPAITLPEVIADIKPGASVILEARSTREKNRVVPLLIEERYGRGRTLALMASDTWRWRMMLESKNKSFETFWTNLLRYLVEGSRRRVEAATERSYYQTGEQVRIRVEVGDEKFLNVADAQVTARVTTPSGGTLDVAMKAIVDEGFEGYTGTLIPDEEGLHRIEVAARRGAGERQMVLGEGKASFLVGPLNIEMREAAQNRELLKRLAIETGGAYYNAEQAANLIEDMAHTEGAGSMRVSYDLWDMPVNFLLVIGLAAAEWFIRKRKGLA